MAKCSVCMKHKKSQQKEPMFSHNIIDGRWEKMAKDIMTLHGQDYLVLVDYYSKYPEFTHLRNKSAKTIVAHMKSVCSRHGIPEEIISDNMPFTSHEFCEFARYWGIKVTISSPVYPQSNGQAEQSIQTRTNISRKQTRMAVTPTWQYWCTVTPQ